MAINPFQIQHSTTTKIQPPLQPDDVFSLIQWLGQVDGQVDGQHPTDQLTITIDYGATTFNLTARVVRGVQLGGPNQQSSDFNSGKDRLNSLQG